MLKFVFLNLGTIAVCLFHQLDFKKASVSVFNKIPMQARCPDEIQQVCV